MNRLDLHVLRDHLLLGAGVAAALSPVWGWKASALFWAASILIDVDHYLHFLYYTRFKDWSPAGMFAFHRWLLESVGREDFLAIEVFHCAEFLLAAAAAALALPALVPALCGMLFHVLVDLVFLGTKGLAHKRAHAFLDYWLRRRRLARKGLSPGWMYSSSNS